MTMVFFFFSKLFKGFFFSKLRKYIFFVLKMLHKINKVCNLGHIKISNPIEQKTPS